MYNLTLKETKVADIQRASIGLMKTRDRYSSSSFQHEVGIALQME